MRGVSRPGRVGPVWLLGLLVLAGCVATDPAPPSSTTTTTTTTTSTTTTSPTPTPATTAVPTPTLPPGVTPPPAWLGTRPLPLDAAGKPLPAPTPPELSDRRFTTDDLLDPPPDDRFHSSVGPVPKSVVARSTWTEDCPVGLEDLSYLTLTFRGFDARPHTGEMIVAREVASDVVAVFADLYAAGFPIEEMRVTARAELEADPTGDGNTTGAFVCRPVTGGRGWSEHAYGLAIDVNPFHNPYVRDDLVLPELAGDYTDRSRDLPGMIVEGDAVTAAFDAIDWEWGGRWSSLKDYQHFSLRGR